MPDIMPAPRLPVPSGSLAAAYTHLTSKRWWRADVSAVASSLRAAVRNMFATAHAWWREVEPDMMVDRRNSIERWDGRGEGRATSIAFEGLGLSFALFIGRYPRPRADLSGEDAAA